MSWKLAAGAIAYLLLLGFGLRSIWRKGRKRDTVWFLGLVGWCTYMSLAKVYDWPSGSILTLHTSLFSPVGQWLEHFIGGYRI